MRDDSIYPYKFILLSSLFLFLSLIIASTIEASSAIITVATTATSTAPPPSPTRIRRRPIISISTQVPCKDIIISPQEYSDLHLNSLSIRLARIDSDDDRQGKWKKYAQKNRWVQQARYCCCCCCCCYYCCCCGY